MKLQDKRDIREAILDIIERKGEVDIFYLENNLSKRKTIKTDVTYSAILDNLYWLDNRGDIEYLGHSIWRSK